MATESGEHAAASGRSAFAPYAGPSRPHSGDDNASGESETADVLLSLQTRPPKNKHDDNGPVRTMRQLVRALIVIFPQSVSAEERPLFSKNRLAKSTVMTYLDRVLGPGAPRPEWGLCDGGCVAYLQALFGWAGFPNPNTTPVFTSPGCQWTVNAAFKHAVMPHLMTLPLHRPAPPAAPEVVWLLVAHHRNADGAWVPVPDALGYQMPDGFCPAPPP